MVDLRVEQITVWDRLHADCEISISSNQYSKSKTTQVKKSYRSSLKKKSIFFFSPSIKLLARLYLGQCHSGSSNQYGFLDFMSYLLLLPSHALPFSL